VQCLLSHAGDLHLSQNTNMQLQLFRSRYKRQLIIVTATLSIAGIVDFVDIPENTAFRKLDVLPSSGEKKEST
jgi:hypothetical protein